jgi:putative heme iron utilization protein
MSTKKRKQLGSAIEELVFGTKEALPVPTPSFVVSPSAPEAFQTAEISPHRPANTVRFMASRYTTAAGEALAAEPVSVHQNRVQAAMNFLVVWGKI